MIANETFAELQSAVYENELLYALLGEIERSHRIVFHGLEGADWSLVRASAEQILIAELQLRHRGNPDGVKQFLARRERTGVTQAEALAEYAAAMHSYFTTPLGLGLRRRLFGPKAVFLTPHANEWAAGVSDDAPQETQNA
jgi:hypothetical protein